MLRQMMPCVSIPLLNLSVTQPLFINPLIYLHDVYKTLYNICLSSFGALPLFFFCEESCAIPKMMPTSLFSPLSYTAVSVCQPACLSSVLQAAAVVVRDDPLVVFTGTHVVCDPGVLVAAVVVAAALLGVVQELSGKHGLHL